MHYLIHNKHCFYTEIVSGTNSFYKIYERYDSCVCSNIVYTLIICIKLNTKCIENSFYLLGFFYLDLCRTRHDVLPYIYVLAAIVSPFFSSWYKSTEWGDVFTVSFSSSILFFLIHRTQDLYSTLSQYRLCWIPPLYFMLY